MLTDMMAEDEFENKQEQSWFDQQDLEHDLQLAAKLGKTLLERNHELEQSLKQRNATNQEQHQEIEHLSKQVDILRTVNDQHAKVYEQLDATAQDLEQSNQRLVLDNRSDQVKIERLTETINRLHCQVEELQKEVEMMKTQQRPELLEPQRSASSQSDRNPLSEDLEDKNTVHLKDADWEDEEHTALLHSVASLQVQLNAEQGLRKAAEQEVKTLAQEMSEIEPSLSLLDGYKSRLAELESEVEELRQLLRSSTASRMLNNTIFLPLEDEMSEMWQGRQTLRRCSSEKMLQARNEDESLRNVKSTDGFRYLEMKRNHGISLLSEVDAQYNALQRKYDALLHCYEGGLQSLTDKAVQTSTTSLHLGKNPVKLGCSHGVSRQETTQLPEYKVLFNEIFTHIQKSKEDIGRNKNKSS